MCSFVSGASEAEGGLVQCVCEWIDVNVEVCARGCPRLDVLEVFVGQGVHEVITHVDKSGGGFSGGGDAGSVTAVGRVHCVHVLVSYSCIGTEVSDGAIDDGGPFVSCSKCRLAG